MPLILPCEHITVYEDDEDDAMEDVDSVFDTSTPMDIENPYQEVASCRKSKDRPHSEPERKVPKTLVDFATPYFFDVLRNNNIGYRPIQWEEHHDIITMVPTFVQRTLSIEEHAECITTIQQVGSTQSFDVDKMSIERLNEVHRKTILRVELEDLQTYDIPSPRLQQTTSLISRSTRSRARLIKSGPRSKRSTYPPK
jgi:hypothetical protein